MSEETDSRIVLDSLRRIVHALRLFDRDAEKRVGLSGAQVFVLQKLSLGDSVSINELAERTHTHQSSVSVVAAKLVERGLVRRETSEKDARRVELTLTKKGLSTLERAPAAAQDRLIASLRRMERGRRHQLAELLVRLTESMDVAGESPALFFEDHGSSFKSSNAHRLHEEGPLPSPPPDLPGEGIRRKSTVRAREGKRGGRASNGHKKGKRKS